MKKILVAVMLIAAVAVNAQSFKPEAGKLGMELQVSGLTDVSLQDGMPGVGKLVLTYSFTDEIGFRLGFGFSSESTSDDNGLSAPATNRKTETSESSFMVSPGIVYSFAGTEKLTPYVGAEFGVGSTSYTEEETVNSGSGDVKTKEENTKKNFNAFGLGVFAGFNYYFAKNIYIGAECGLGFSSLSLKKWKITSPTSTTESKDEISGSAFGVSVNPALRLGWVF